MNISSLLVCDYSFYNLDSTDFDKVNRYLSSLVEKALVELECSYCLEVAEVSLLGSCVFAVQRCV